MQRSAIACLCLCLAAASSACRSDEPRTVAINEEGCVTSSGDEFILTDLHPGERSEELEHLLPEAPRPTPTTEAYLLMGDEQLLRSLTGRRVRVAGVVDPAQVAELRSISPLVGARPAGQGPGETAVAEGAAPPPEGTAATSGTAEGEPTPRVATQHQLRMEIHHMRLTSIEATGDACGAMTNPGS